ncbi:Uncharacterised protein [uncultured archaeon]|nr:Uncharacterised protein [uncultured archaeon]
MKNNSISCPKCGWHSIIDLNAGYVKIPKIVDGISFLFPVAEPKFTFINCPNCGSQIKLTEKKK